MWIYSMHTYYINVCTHKKTHTKLACHMFLMEQKLSLGKGTTMQDISPQIEYKGPSSQY